jgi:hypothetical protein
MSAGMVKLSGGWLDAKSMNLMGWMPSVLT